MNIITFDTNQRNTTIELSTTEVVKIKNLLLLAMKEERTGYGDLYKDFFILTELLTCRRLGFLATEYYNSIGFGNSEGNKD